ncbi:tyrosine--tRNA ligase [Lactococcus lactis]|uniref:tyrosine--tRNA ligase n=1 Tax=Lactococcus lactis TaxID=1358 RepID=UPI000727B451|nr:tyrosine--tRNA ligase [Lactococcus lactis]KSU13978.1 Tyrosyl-tRNA synthetase [Lactococcus lactis subsp. lactis]
MKEVLFMLEKNIIIEKLRRLTSEIIDEDSILNKLDSNNKLIIKFGADPTRPDLHLGHSVALRGLRIFQELGHEIVFVIGDYTAMIGDPSGKSKTRVSLSYEETRKSAETYYQQVTKILDKNKTRIVFNSEWLGKLSFENILELTSKYTVAQLMERDDFSKRFKNKLPIGIHELLYPLMQGYDSVELKADIEVGGTDQTFNLLLGRELQKKYGIPSQDIITFPLLVGLDGKNKMSKSLDNYIGIDESPAIIFEKIMKIPDDILESYFKLTTDIEEKEYLNWISEDIFEAHKKYARIIIMMYHGKNEISMAESQYESIAKGGIPNNLPEVFVSKENLLDNFNLQDLLKQSGIVNSKSEGKRLSEQGGISINDERITDPDKRITLSDFVDNQLIIKRGKNKFWKIILQ